MNHLKNKNIKYLIIPMIILTIATSMAITIQAYNQYKKITTIANQKIAEIIGTIIKENPEIDTRTIIKTLNSKQDTEEYQKGQEELKKYGININEANSIIAVQNQMKQNLVLNILLIIVFSILWMAIIFVYLRKRDRKINQITQYINQIKNRKYDLDINENSEDELSNLKNELYKITIMLKEESEISKKDKDNLKMSVEDISHQLKTPLTSITIMLDNLKDNPNMDENTKQKFIFEISKQIDWINWLVISMLKLSKLDANVVQFYEEKINLKKFIEEIIKNLEIPIEIKNQQIIIEGNESASFVGDYKWQQEAVTNIIKNCIEHNKENGKIYIKYEENTLFTKITIRDEGEGMTKEDLKHIFERFYKGQNSSENSVGIGLALAKNIIEKNNGMISCKSELDKGTEFVIKYMK
ncbi:integral membrane sensor signal transduction histidine kinase [Clostridium sp. CAG:470]|nr:integral membrane sensor signal transduction histidine kinase [Clostridium sp. CAG:470]